MSSLNKFIIASGIIFILFVVGHYFLGPAINLQNQIGEICKKENISNCDWRDIECLNSCRSFGLDYFKFDLGGFGNDECWCREGNSTKQIY